MDLKSLIGRTIVKVNGSQVKADESEFEEDYSIIDSITLDNGKVISFDHRGDSFLRPEDVVMVNEH